MLRQFIELEPFLSLIGHDTLQQLLLGADKYEQVQVILKRFSDLDLITVELSFDSTTFHRARTPFDVTINIFGEMR